MSTYGCEPTPTDDGSEYFPSPSTVRDSDPPLNTEHRVHTTDCVTLHICEDDHPSSPSPHIVAEMELEWRHAATPCFNQGFPRTSGIVGAGKECVSLAGKYGKYRVVRRWRIIYEKTQITIPSLESCTTAIVWNASVYGTLDSCKNWQTTRVVTNSVSGHLNKQG